MVARAFKNLIRSKWRQIKTTTPTTTTTIEGDVYSRTLIDCLESILLKSLEEHQAGEGGRQQQSSHESWGEIVVELRTTFDFEWDASDDLFDDLMVYPALLKRILGLVGAKTPKKKKRTKKTPRSSTRERRRRTSSREEISVEEERSTTKRRQTISGESRSANNSNSNNNNKTKKTKRQGSLNISKKEEKEAKAKHTSINLHPLEALRLHIQELASIIRIVPKVKYIHRYASQLTSIILSILIIKFSEYRISFEEGTALSKLGSFTDSNLRRSRSALKSSSDMSSGHSSPIGSFSSPDYYYDLAEEHYHQALQRNPSDSRSLR